MCKGRNNIVIFNNFSTKISIKIFNVKKRKLILYLDNHTCMYIENYTEWKITNLALIRYKYYYIIFMYNIIKFHCK